MPVDRDPEAGESVGAPTDEQLAARLSELENAVADLRDRSMRRRRGLFGLPRPPTPREFVELTDRYGIPATIAFLEANIRALEALQATLRVARGSDDTRDRASEARERTAELGAKTLDALDAALEELKDAYREGALPSDPESRSILQEAQRLTEEIRDDLRAKTESSRRRTGRDSTRTRGESTRDPRVDPSEVETELEMLRDQYETTKIDVMGPGDEEDDTAGSDIPDERTGTDQAEGTGETDSVDGRHARDDEPAGADLDDDRDESDVPDEFFEDDENEDDHRGT